jgi:hypothetical protein
MIRFSGNFKSTQLVSKRTDQQRLMDSHVSSDALGEGADAVRWFSYARHVQGHISTVASKLLPGCEKQKGHDFKSLRHISRKIRNDDNIKSLRVHAAHLHYPPVNGFTKSTEFVI